MADLIVYLPAHRYSDDDPVFVSWLDGVYYINDPATDSFKLTDGADGANIAYTENIIDGYVRKVDVSSGSSTITGLDHLEGATVYVTSGGENLGAYVVSGGAITVTSDVYTYQVGLPYSMKVVTMRLEVPGTNTQTRIKRIHEAVIRHIRTKGGQAGQVYGGREYLSDLNAGFATTSADATILNKGGFDPDAYTIIKSSGPEPMTILASVVSVEAVE